MITTRATGIPLLALTLTVGLGGCYYYDCPETASVSSYQDPAYVEVQSEPPALQAAVEERPPKPNPNAVWVGGHYDWRDRWVWVDGHWETPRAGHVWTAPTVVRVEGGFRYHPGYWRPRNADPAPVYRRPGTVAVSVRPRTTTTVRQGGGTQTATVQGGGTVERGSGGAVTVQGGGNTAPRPNATVQGGTRTTATPGTRATTTVQGGTRTTATPGTRATTTVQGGVRTANTPTVQQGGTVRVQTPNAGTRTPGGATVRTPTDNRPAQTTTVRGGVRAGSPGTAATAVGGTRQTGSGTVALTCRTNTTRAPRGGYITIRGTGFGQGATVMIGGNIAAVSRTQNGRIRAQVPQDSNGGRVTLRDANRTASCGTLDIVGRSGN